MNYSVQQYADSVVSVLAGLCAEHHQPMPALISESGRALTAHHAVLVAPVVTTEQMPDWNPATAELESAHELLLAIRTQAQLAQSDSASAEELWLDAGSILNQARDAFMHGLLALVELAELESIYFYILQQLQQQRQPIITHCFGPHQPVCTPHFRGDSAF